MSTSDTVAISGFFFLLAGVIYGAGRVVGALERFQETTTKQINGLGGITRRMMFLILTQTPEKDKWKVLWFLTGGGGQP